MMFPCALFVLAVVAPASDADKKALVLEFEAAAGVDQEAKQVSEIVASIFSEKEGVEVLTGRDVRAMIELETDRQIKGCDTSCMSEIAGAMGAELVISGSVGRLGQMIIVTVNVFDSKSARSLGRKTVRATALEDLPELLDKAVGELAGDVIARGASTSGGSKSGGSTSGGSTSGVSKIPGPLFSPLFLGGAGLAGASLLAVVVSLALVGVNNDIVSTKSATAKDDALLWGRLSLASSLFFVATTGVGLGLMALPWVQE